jgi:hypothetical protein
MNVEWISAVHPPIVLMDSLRQKLSYGAPYQANQRFLNIYRLL